MTTAADIMTRDVVTVSPETSVHDVAELLAKQRFGSVPVMDQGGIVQGIVTEEDLVTRTVELHIPRHVEFLGGIIYLENPQRFQEEAKKILAMTARDIMDAHIDTVRPDTPIGEVANRMLEEDIRRMLVLDEQSRLAGIITRADIVRMLAKNDRLPDET